MRILRDIRNLLKILVVLLPVILILPSCSADGAIEQNDNPDAEAEQMKGCWQEAVIEDLYTVMGETAMGMYEKITKGAMAAVMVGFAIWFALRLLKYTGSVAEENPGQLWNDILRKLFLCFFCGLIASSTDNMLYLINTFVFPIYNAFLELGSRVLTAVAENDGVKFSGQGEELKILGGVFRIERTVMCVAEGSKDATLSGFPTSTLSMMQCMICSINERLTLGYNIAYRVLQGRSFMATVNALLLIICFTIIKVSFVFYLVDNIFKFAVIVIMMPILVMAYPFQDGWAKFGFKTILTSSAFMMAIAVMIAMALMAIVQIIQQNPDVFDPKDAELQINEFTAVMLALLLIAFLITGTIKVAREITTGLVGGSVDNEFQKKLLGVALLAVHALTGGLTKGLTKIGFVMRAKDKLNNSALGKAMEKRREIIDRVNELAGRKP